MLCVKPTIVIFVFFVQGVVRALDLDLVGHQRAVQPVPGRVQPSQGRAEHPHLHPASGRSFEMSGSVRKRSKELEKHLREQTEFRNVLKSVSIFDKLFFFAG